MAMAIAAASSLSAASFLSFRAPTPPLPRLSLPSRSFLALSSAVSPGALPLSVSNPALAYSNTLLFSGYNVQVVVKENEPEEQLLNRFRREVMRAGVIQECKRRRFFENKQEEKKRKTREAAKRNRRRRPQWRNFLPTKPETTGAKKNDDDEDNWDLPEDEAIPY